jgi:hypothetical protein
MAVTWKEGLRRVPFLYFMACIVDPECKHSQDEIVHAVIKKFDFKNDVTEINQINGHLSKIIVTEDKKDLFLELAVTGFIRIWKKYKLLTYKEYEMEVNVYSTIEVNSKEVETKQGWDEESMLSLKESLITLYSIEEKTLSWSQVFEQCWKMFEKGSRSDALKEFSWACDKLVENDDSEIDIADKYTIWAKWIKSKWDEYLWEKHESNAKTEYVLGIKEFISRNLDSWMNGKENHAVKIKVYSDEHEEAINYFYIIEEKIIAYIRQWASTE